MPGPQCDESRAHPGQVDVEVAQFAAALGRAEEQHRHPVAVRLLEPRVAVDVDHNHLHAMGRRQRPHGRQHLVAEVTVASAEERQLQ